MYRLCTVYIPLGALYVAIQLLVKFEKHGFFYAQTLFAGTLRECLDYPTAFKTTLPSSYDLPELDGNICEGVVIRPISPTFLCTGSRVLIKNKNDRWAENNNFIDKAVLGKSLREDEALSEEAMVLCEEIHRFITTNRLENLISKIGEVNPDKEFGKVLGLYNQDVLADFFKTHQDKYDELEKRESKAVTKFLNKHASQLITKYLGQ